jgi:outer membrane protein assembly factor BamB
MTGLRERWNEVIPDAEPLADDLVERYAARYRERYLKAVLTELDSRDQLTTDRTAVRLAAWFHRAVRQPGGTPADDAEASAQLAERVLPSYGVSDARTAEVARLVRLTGSGPEYEAQDPNADALLAAVNAVLAAERAELPASDSRLWSPWRGWQRAALVTTAIMTAFVAFLAAVGAARAPWRVPAYGGDSAWPSAVQTLLAVGAIVALYQYSRRAGRRSWIVAGAVMAVGLAGLVLVWITAPPTNPSSGVGERLPLLVTSSVLLIVAGGASLGASALSRQTQAARNRGQVLAGLGMTILIILATIFGIDPLQRSYLLSANESLEGQHQPANLNIRSDLTGGVAWTNTAPPRSGGGSLGDAVATRHGIAVSRGTGTVEMLDPATGQMRWRYARPDTKENARFSVLSGGELLLVFFDDIGYFVLDADTGQRKAAWPERTRDNDIENKDPLLTAQPVSKGSDKLYGTNLDGSNRWTFTPGRCSSTSAAATADTVVAGLWRNCRQSNEVVGLNVSDGKQIWSHPGSSLYASYAVGGLIVGVEPDAGSGKVSGRGTLVGMEARSGTVKWRWPMPTQWACSPRIEPTGNLIILFSCPNSAESGSHTVTTAIDATTGRMVWTATTEVFYGLPHAVTADGRAVYLYADRGGCRLTTVSEHGTNSLLLQKPVVCSRGVAAADNLILVGGNDSIIALR